MIIPKKYIVGIFTLFYFFPSFLFASDKILNLGQINESPISLTDYFSVLEDSSTNLNVDDVLKPGLANTFKPTSPSTDPNGLNYGFTNSAYWLRISLSNNGEKLSERLFEISYPRLANIEFYEFEKGIRINSITTGIKTPFATRPYKNRNFVFPISIAPNTEKVILIRVQSRLLQIPARLWTPDSFHEHELKDYISQAGYFGIMAAMIVYNLFLFLSLRDQLYLQYSLFVIFVALATASENGLALQYLWGNSTDWATKSILEFYSLASFSFLPFLRRMLNTAEIMPRANRFLILLTFVWIIFAVGLTMFFSLFFKIHLFLLVITLISILGVVFYGVYKRQRSAIIFLLAFSVFFLVMPANILYSLGLFNSSLSQGQLTQFGSTVEVMLLAFALADRYTMMRKEKEEAQQSLVENLKQSERNLEERVNKRTVELLETNKTLESTLNNLKDTQEQLVQSEKMASLGQLVANIAHEINTPIGAVKASGKNIEDSIDKTLTNFPKLFQVLNSTMRELFLQLIHSKKDQRLMMLSSREERTLVKEATKTLEAYGIEEARSIAETIVQLGLQDSISDYLLLLKHPERNLIFESAKNIANIVNSTHNINMAVDKVAKIIYALKSFSRVNNTDEMVNFQLKESIEIVLTIYHNQIKQGIDIIRKYEEIPDVFCFPDELNQIWTNLIHNSIQAMKNRGTITISIRQANKYAIVSIADNGHGIPESILPKIFDPFFTTKPAGEGSGLGLGIVKRIIDKHNGRIEVKTEVGVGTEFLVYFPIREVSNE